jgi:hypothetical protein
MQDKRRGRPPLMKVERAFAGSRLEQPLLRQVYELAAPRLRRRPQAVPLPEPPTRFVRDPFPSHCVARGA